ncbi:NADAR family protein [Parendozoicomonas sp. Alg238-R29]|uniref:NADAR family protein n=1 Tax=Parendozoicomonas sp. Alg238-R29 TaxID=2993446 RepID=UPI00248E7127|nr:NADAR family protein [Parendozoicomonas sp. Alg238-R29]
MDASRRIHGHPVGRLIKDIKQHPEDYRLGQGKKGTRLETSTGLIVWRKRGKVYTCTNREAKRYHAERHQAQLLEQLQQQPATDQSKNLLDMIAKPVPHTVISEHRPHRSFRRGTSLHSFRHRPRRHRAKKTQRHKQHMVKRSRQWLGFISGQEPKDTGCPLSLRKMLQASESELENNRHFIQWYFPKTHISRNHLKAPLLTPEMVNAVQTHPGIRQNTHLMIKQMLNHWGITLKDGKFILDKSQSKKYLRWLPFPGCPDNNHNQPLISQMLRFMQECQMPEVKALHDFIQQRRVANYLPPNPEWSKAIGVKCPAYKSTPAPTSATATAPTLAAPVAATATAPTPVATPTAATATSATPSTPSKRTPALHSSPKPQPKPQQIERVAPVRNQTFNGPNISYVIPVKHADGIVRPTYVEPTNYEVVTGMLNLQGTHPQLQGKINNNQIQSTNGCVRFYDRRFNKDTHYLTNTYVHMPQRQPVFIMIDGYPYKSVEHYFQHQKYVLALRDDANPVQVQQARQAILQAQWGRDASNAGKPGGPYYHLVDPAKWHRNSHHVMYKAIYAKFKTNQDLKAKLMATYPCVIIEDTANDRFWGNNGDDTGFNLTGQILGLVRDQIMREEGFIH